MKRKIHIAKLESMLALIATFGLNIPIYSCVITFTNDSPAEVLIINEAGSNSKAYKVAKNKTIKFGDPHIKAQFKIFDKNQEHDSFDLFCTCKQEACAGDGSPKVAYSDIVKNTEIMNLFSVNKAQRTPVNSSNPVATVPTNTAQTQ